MKEEDLLPFYMLDQMQSWGLLHLKWGGGFDQPTERDKKTNGDTEWKR